MSYHIIYFILILSKFYLTKRFSIVNKLIIHEYTAYKGHYFHSCQYGSISVLMVNTSFKSGLCLESSQLVPCPSPAVPAAPNKAFIKLHQQLI